MASNKDVSYESFLNEKPPLDELIKYIDINNEWLLVGLMLKLDKKDLDKLPSGNIDSVYGGNEFSRAQAIIELWLNTTGASRRQLLKDLRESSDTSSVAKEYERHLVESYETSCKYYLYLTIQYFFR